MSNLSGLALYTWTRTSADVSTRGDGVTIVRTDYGHRRMGYQVMTISGEKATRKGSSYVMASGTLAGAKALASEFLPVAV